jgi:flagellar P-ring protein FlgI
VPEESTSKFAASGFSRNQLPQTHIEGTMNAKRPASALYDSMHKLLAWVVCVIALNAAGSTYAEDQLMLRDICRLKGLEANTLQGLGLVVGLKGTGDGKMKPTTRALARMMEIMGSNIATDAQGLPKIEELAEANNIALVVVTAEVPQAGAQQGDTVDCTISAISAKSLEGGTLMLTPLLGPRADRPTVYALAQGKITIPNPAIPTGGTVHKGCKMEATIRNNFVADNKITLIVDSDVSSFSIAQNIEDEINNLNRSGLSGLNSIDQGGAGEQLMIAQAIDPHHVEVTIPKYYRNSPVKFISLIMDVQLRYVQNARRVVINESEGVVIVGENVLIAPVAITHKNLTIEARPGQDAFVGVDIENPNQPRAKLKNLTEALNKLDVPTDDVISIIKALKAQGVLYGELVKQ